MLLAALVAGCILELNPQFGPLASSSGGATSTGGAAFTPGVATASPPTTGFVSTGGQGTSAGVNATDGSTAGALDDATTSSDSSSDAGTVPSCTAAGPFVVGDASVPEGPAIAMLGDQLGVLWERARAFERLTLDGEIIGLREEPLGYEVFSNELLAVEDAFLVVYETTFHGELHQLYSRARIAAGTWAPHQRISDGSRAVPATAWNYRGQVLAAWRREVLDIGFSLSDREGTVTLTGMVPQGFSNRPVRVFEDGEQTLLLIQADNRASRLIRLDGELNLQEVTLLNPALSDFVFEDPGFTMVGMVMDNLVLAAHDGVAIDGELTLIESSPAEIGELHLLGGNGSYVILKQEGQSPQTLSLTRVVDGELYPPEIIADAAVGRVRWLDVGDGRFVVGWTAINAPMIQVMVQVFCW